MAAVEGGKNISSLLSNFGPNPVGAAIGGGKFSNGSVSASFVWIFNEVSRWRGGPLVQKTIRRGDDYYTVWGIEVNCGINFTDCSPFMVKHDDPRNSKFYRDDLVN
jgi:hypothetical protein